VLNGADALCSQALELSPTLRRALRPFSRGGQSDSRWMVMSALKGILQNFAQWLCAACNESCRVPVSKRYGSAAVMAAAKVACSDCPAEIGPTTTWSFMSASEGIGS
jgi:hypothetical protein